MARPRAKRTMRAAIIKELGEIKVGDRPYPVVAEPTDAVVRVVLARRHPSSLRDDLGRARGRRSLRAVRQGAIRHMVPVRRPPR
jgi:transposase